MLALIKEENNRRVRTFNNKTHSKTEWLQKSQNYQDIIARFTSQLVVKTNGGKITAKEITQEEYDFAIKAIERKDEYVAHYHNILKPAIESGAKTGVLKYFDIKSDSHWDKIKNK